MRTILHHFLPGRKSGATRETLTDSREALRAVKFQTSSEFQNSCSGLGPAMLFMSDLPHRVIQDKIGRGTATDAMEGPAARQRIIITTVTLAFQAPKVTF